MVLKLAKGPSIKEPLKELALKSMKAGQPAPFSSAHSAPQMIKWDPHGVTATPEEMWSRALRIKGLIDLLVIFPVLWRQ